MRLVCTRRHEDDWSVPHLLHFTDVVCLQRRDTAPARRLHLAVLRSLWGQPGQRSLHTPRVATAEPLVCQVLYLRLLYRHTQSLCSYTHLFFHLYWDTIHTVHPNHSPRAPSSSGHFCSVHFQSVHHSTWSICDWLLSIAWRPQLLSCWASIHCGPPHTSLAVHSGQTSSVGGHLFCSHLVALRNLTAVSTTVHVCMVTCAFIFLRVDVLGQTVTVCSEFVGAVQLSPQQPHHFTPQR